MMNVIAALKVFRGSALVTAQGEVKISRVFPDSRAANKAGYYYCRTEDGTAVYSRRSNTGKKSFAAVGG
jgi:hypothetical protein